MIIDQKIGIVTPKLKTHPRKSESILEFFPNLSLFLAKPLWQVSSPQLNLGEI